MISFWEKDALSSFDVIIVGGGILGLLTSIEVAKKYQGASIAILERSLFSMGATTRNAGFACFGSASEIQADRGRLGNERTLTLIEKRWKGLKALEKRYGNDIDYENLGGYELIFDDGNTAGFLEDVNQFLKPIFNSDVFQWMPEAIGRFGFNKASVLALIGNSLEGQIHSGKLVKRLHLDLKAFGIQFFANSELTNYQKGISIHAEVNHQYELKCSQLIFCTNAFSPIEINTIQPGRGQVLITHPIPNLPFKGTFHFDEGYYYFRNIGDRVLFGGGRNLDLEGEKNSTLELNDFIQSNLEEKLRQTILPNQPFKVDMRWSGIMAFSNSRLPEITKIEDNILYAMNCNGMGISLSPITAEEIAELL